MDTSADPSKIDPRVFRDAMGRFASGVTVVAAIEDGQPIGFTCQSFVSLSLDPPLIAICPAKSSTSWPKMISAGRFSVNVLAGDQAGEATAFAVSGGDKFEGVGWRIGRFGTPIIDGVVVSIECDLRSIHETGDHELVVGEVLALDASDRDPLIFYRGRFTSLPDICSADVRTDP